MKDEFTLEMLIDYNTKPEDGAYIYGLSMEGARWDYEKHIVTHSRPKELFTTFPLILIVPKNDREKPQSGIYDCPVYRILSRTG